MTNIGLEQYMLCNPVVW